MTNIILDATMLTSIQACALMSDYRFNHHLQSLSGKSNSLEVGSIIHKVLEVYYQGRVNGFNHKLCVANGLTAGHMYVTGDKSNIEEYPGVTNTPATNETKPYRRIGYEWALQTAEDYLEYRKNDSWIPVAAEKVRGKILYEDDEIRILWKSKIDLEVDTNDGVRPVDHKTMSQSRPSLALNNQFMGLCLVSGTQSVIINKIGLQTSLPIDKRFIRDTISYTKEQLLEWQSQTLPYYAKLWLIHNESGYFPPNLTHCENKYGRCNFYSVCSSNPELRNEMLSKEFTVGPVWDPTNDSDNKSDDKE
jgi:hypothetical protein